MHGCLFEVFQMQKSGENGPIPASAVPPLSYQNSARTAPCSAVIRGCTAIHPKPRQGRPCSLPKTAVSPRFYLNRLRTAPSICFPLRSDRGPLRTARRPPSASKFVPLTAFIRKIRSKIISSSFIHFYTFLETNLKDREVKEESSSCHWRQIDRDFIRLLDLTASGV